MVFEGEEGLRWLGRRMIEVVKCSRRCDVLRVVPRDECPGLAADDSMSEVLCRGDY